MMTFTLKIIFLFIVLRAIAQEWIQLAEFLSEKYSFVEVIPSSPAIAAYCLKETNFPVYIASTISSKSQACESPANAFQKIEPQNIAPQCFPAFSNLGFVQNRLKIYTSFFEVDQLIMAFDVFFWDHETIMSGIPELKKDETIIVKKLQESTTFELANRRFFYTIAEGKKVFEFFHDHHLSRGLSIRRNVKTRLWYNSHPRSGTNLVQKVLEEVLQEFIQSGVGQYFGPFDDNVIAGELKGNLVKETTGITRFHLMLLTVPWLMNQEKLISKVISLVRSPMLSLDSYFHLSMTHHEHYCKLIGDFQNEPLYNHFVKVNGKELEYSVDITRKMAYDKGVPTIYLRYEDILERPLEEFCKMISIYSGVPCELTHKKKLEKYIKEQGLSSFYKKSGVGAKETNSDLLGKFSLKNIETVFNVTISWLDDFGYRCQYERILFKNCSQTPSRPFPFQIANNETLKQVLSYTHEKIDKSKLLVPIGVPPPIEDQDSNKKASEIIRHFISRFNMTCK